MPFMWSLWSIVGVMIKMNRKIENNLLDTHMRCIKIGYYGVLSWRDQGVRWITPTALFYGWGTWDAQSN